MENDENYTGAFVGSATSIGFSGALYLGNTPINYSMTIGPISIHPDGTITRNAGFTTTDEASLAFWECVEQMGLKLAAKNGAG